jgi:hypothetical protein
LTRRSRRTARPCRAPAGALAAVLALSLANPAGAIPPNATAIDSGVGWRCNTGYQRAGGGCRRIVAKPVTGSRSQGSYTCPPGQQRVGGECRQVQVPDNAYRSGVDWACDAGHYRSGGRCRELDTPATVTAPPLVDSCDGGYVLVDGVCRMDVPERPRLGD